jgi:hypothetical protein
VDAKGEALGVSDLDVPALVRRVSSSSSSEGHVPGLGRALDAYIEAQVHGDIVLATDAESIVVDPAFDGTPTGDALRELCAKCRIAHRFHPGFVLPTSAVPDDFRGPRMTPLADLVDRRFAAVKGELDAATVGRAAASLHLEPDTWADWAPPDQTFQELKQLWHVLVRFGQARRRATRAS